VLSGALRFPARVRCYPATLLLSYSATLLLCLLLLLCILYISDTYIFSYLGHAVGVT